MGSKNSENDDHGGYGDPSDPPKVASAGGQPRGAQHSRDGDGSLGDGGDSDDSDADENAASVSVALKDATTTADASKKKKRKRSKKKKKTGALKQSSPPRVPLDELFPSGEFPTGEFVEYNTARTTKTELRYKARNLEDPNLLKDYRKAAETHRQVRRWVQETAKPGVTLAEIAVGIDDGVRALLGNEGKETGAGLISGLGFPTGLSLNNIVAHFTPNPGQKDIVLQQSDVMKVDFGVHVNGWIVDSAFTMSFDPVYDTLLQGVKEATNAGIKAAGIDVRISDVSAAIQETMESHEVTINGKTQPIQPVRNICAHDIKQFRIHGSKQIPFIKNKDQTKMEEGEIFAIETFGTTGKGILRDGEGVYGYGLQYDAPKQLNLPLASAGKLHKKIRENFGSLVFCRRYLEHIGQERYLAGLNCLVNHGVLESYAPLVDIKGSYSAQFEHTILLREASKEVISRGVDY